LNGGEPVQLGGRAFDILVALTERAGQVVSKTELMDFVWPDTTVDEGTLRFHVASLRKALGEGDSGRYVTTVHGGGYCFVAPALRIDTQSGTVPERASLRLPRRLPLYPSRMVGRDEILQNLAAQLKAERFVTIVGPGGIGKTMLAVAAGRALIAEFKGDVVFVDLAPIQGPRLVPGAKSTFVGERRRTR
jgi:hypothetical protein